MPASDEQFEQIRQRFISVMVDAGAIRRKAGRGKAGKEPVRTALNEVVQLANLIDLAMREMYHFLPEHMRPEELPPPYTERNTISKKLREPRSRELRQGGSIPHNVRYPEWTEQGILELADAYYSFHGKWPTAGSGKLCPTSPDTWSGINLSLVGGYRGLPGGSSLRALLGEHRVKRIGNTRRPVWTDEEILQLADAYFEVYGKYPTSTSGKLNPTSHDTWMGISIALQKGNRGLPGGSSLAKLLDARRGVPNRMDLPCFDVDVILRWADSHFAANGRWPLSTSGSIADAPHETWLSVDQALRNGSRGLSAGSSLARLLSSYRQVPNLHDLGQLSVGRILEWADAHKAHTGDWPTSKSGVIRGTVGEKWGAINLALVQGKRGLSAGSTLGKLLTEHRGRKIRKSGVCPLTEVVILILADKYHSSHGKWPNRNSGLVGDNSSDTWNNIDLALKHGTRSLSGGTTLANLLATRRNARNRTNLPELDPEKILAWADAWHERTGLWPGAHSGPIPEAPGETWCMVCHALGRGSRGLRSNTTLTRLLAEMRGAPRVFDRKLTIAQILVWSDQHYARNGKWPTRRSGEIPEAPGEKWSAIDAALYSGNRSLGGKSSLALLLYEHRDYGQNRR